MRVATVLALALLLAACSPKAPNATAENSASSSVQVEAAAPTGPKYPAEVWDALGIDDKRCPPTNTRCSRISWESRLVQDRALFTELIGIPLGAWHVEEHVDEEGVEHLEMTVSTAHLEIRIAEWKRPWPEDITPIDVMLGNKILPALAYSNLRVERVDEGAE